MKMTSNCDVTKSANQIQMTTTWPWTNPLHENFLRTPLQVTAVQGAIQEKLTTYSTSTECFKAVVVGLWPVCLSIVAGIVKNRSNSRLTKYFVLSPYSCYNKYAYSKDAVTQWGRGLISLAAFYSTSIDSIHSETAAFFRISPLMTFYYEHLKFMFLKNGNIVTLLEHQYV